MLFRLMLVRFVPLLSLGFLKERAHIKRAVIILLIFYIAGFLTAAGKVIAQKQWLSLLYVPLSMFPQYICYGFAAWMLVRCIWQAWSERVWKRIYLFALLNVLSGIFMERYWNSKILQIFFENFK